MMIGAIVMEMRITFLIKLMSFMSGYTLYRT